MPPAFDCDGRRVRCGPSRQILEDQAQFSLGGFVGRHEIDPPAMHTPLAVIAGTGDFDDIHLGLQQGDEGQEQRTLEPAGIEIVRHGVGGADHDHPAGEQASEQAAPHHGVGDIGDLEFVEAEQADFAGDIPRQYVDGVGMTGGAQRMQPAVDLKHEGGEMDAALLRFGGGVEEQVHQHGLAASDRTPQVKPARGRRLVGENLAEQPARRRPAFQLAPQRVQPLGRAQLGAVRRQRT